MGVVAAATSRILATGHVSPGISPSHLHPSSPKRLPHPRTPPAPPSFPSGWLGAIPARHSDLGTPPPSASLCDSRTAAGTERCPGGFVPLPAPGARSCEEGAHPKCGCGVSGVAGAVPELRRRAGLARQGLTVDYSLCLRISVHNAPAFAYCSVRSIKMNF